jgi:hypothetical protein
MESLGSHGTGVNTPEFSLGLRPHAVPHLSPFVKGGGWIFLSRLFRRLYFQLSTFNFRLSASRGSSLFLRFPQCFRIPPLPQTLSLSQLEPHCVNPATSIRITNKLSLTTINPLATILFDSSSSSSTPIRRPAAALRAASSPRSSRYILTSLSIPICSSPAVVASVLSTFKSFLFRGLRTLFRNGPLTTLFLSIASGTLLIATEGVPLPRRHVTKNPSPQVL